MNVGAIMDRPRSEISRFYATQCKFVALVLENGGKLYGLVVPDFALCEKEGIDKDKLNEIMNENLKSLNDQVAAYERLVRIIIYPNEFEKTPKRSIKRYLYDVSKLV